MNKNDIITIWDVSGFENEYYCIDEISLNGTNYSVYWSEDTRKFLMSENGDGKNGRQEYYDIASPSNNPFSILELEEYIKDARGLLCVKADEAYAKGEFDIALNIFLEAEEKGNAYASLRVGMMFYWGVGCTIDYDVAYMHFKKGAIYGCPIAAAWIAECYRVGRGVEQNEYIAHAIYSAVSNHLMLICDLVDTLVASDKNVAIQYYQYAAEYGIAIDQYILAKAHMRGDHVDCNYELARVWMEKAAHQGIVAAQYELGCLYNSGFGFDNVQYSYRWILNAAEQEYHKAEFTIGTYYLYGIGVVTNIDVANHWFKRAADHGDPRAMHEIGISFFRGRGVQVDLEQAIQYLSAAYKAGNTDSKKPLDLAVQTLKYKKIRELVMTGREKCAFMKQIRKEISERNSIEYLSAECNNADDCPGYCTKCDAESRYLDMELKRLIQSGKDISLVQTVLDIAYMAFASKIADIEAFNPAHTEIDPLSGDIDIRDKLVLWDELDVPTIDDEDVW